MKSLTDNYVMNNGIGIPCVGFGTFLTPPDVTQKAVKEALEAGYRHIDTASYYRNEKGVGEAVRQSGIPREEIFVTTKLWNSDQGYDRALKAFEKSRRELGLDYIDLYLIHWPRIKGHEDQWPQLNRETWKAMTKLYNEGSIKAIGVSNFKPHHIESLMQESDIMPMVNQIELHPGYMQRQTADYCKKNNIVIEAWGPMSRGNMLKSGMLDVLVGKYGKTVAQICLRWHIQHGFLPLPKSVTPERIVENTKLFDFELSEEDMEYIDDIKVDTGTGYDPDKVAH